MQSEIRLPDGLILCAEHAIYCTDDEALAIADLHLGYEASLQAEHVAIPRFQFGPMMAKLDSLIDKYNPKIIIINGDLKHEFSRNIGQEWDEVKILIENLEKRLEVIIIRGNHDNYLRTILSKTGIEVVDSYTLPSGAFEFVHGHKPVDSSSKFRIYAHEHPVIRLRDEIGALITRPCFLYAESNKFIIVPAFSPLASGTNVLSPPETFMIKELRNMDMSHAIVYAIDEEGILDFGDVGNLRTLNEAGIE